MLGAIIGDIVGSRWEFKTMQRKDFRLFCEFNSFTDDTVMTLAVADALLHDLHPADAMRRWAREGGDTAYSRDWRVRAEVLFLAGRT